MTNPSATNYRDIGDTTLAVYKHELDRKGSPIPASDAFMHARPHSALCLAQMLVENQYRTSGKVITPGRYNALGLRPWLNDPRGHIAQLFDWETNRAIGRCLVAPTANGAIRGPDGSLFLTFASDVDCIKEWKRRLFDDPGYKNGNYTDLITLDDMISHPTKGYAPAGDVHPITGVDNADIGYPDLVRDHLNRYLALELELSAPITQIPGAPDMAVYSTTLPGLPGGPLATSFPIRVQLIPASRTYQRPGIKLRGTFDTTQHNTANWNTLAPAEASYFLNGAEGRQASVHAINDDSVLYVILPLDEVGWHAGDGAGPGNMSTIALELTMLRAMVDSPTRWRRAISIAAEFMGRVAARKAGDKIARLHKDWSGKWCPMVLLDRPADLAFYRSEYARFWEIERAAMSGTPTPVEPVIKIGDTIETTVELNLRSSASTSAPVVRKLASGERAVVTGAFESAGGYGWLPVKASTDGLPGYVAMGDSTGAFIRRLDIAPAPTPPTYVTASPIPALLATDLKKYDTATGIVTDEKGNDFVFVADVIEFTKETVAGQYAGPNPQAVKAPYQVGERAIAAWLVEVEVKAATATTDAEFAWFYVLTGGDDEWIRVPYANTVRISDAPLLPVVDEEAVPA